MDMGCDIGLDVAVYIGFARGSEFYLPVMKWSGMTQHDIYTVYWSQNTYTLGLHSNMYFDVQKYFDQNRVRVVALPSRRPLGRPACAQGVPLVTKHVHTWSALKHVLSCTQVRPRCRLAEPLCPSEPALPARSPSHARPCRLSRTGTCSRPVPAPTRRPLRCTPSCRTR